MTEKEFDLKEQPFVELKIRFYRAFNPEEHRGVTCLKVTCATVLDTNNGRKEIGSIAATTDGTMVLTDNIHLHHAEFMCSAEEVWTTFQEALAKKKCPECDMLFQHKPQCSRREDEGQTKPQMKPQTGD